MALKISSSAPFSAEIIVVVATIIVLELRFPRPHDHQAVLHNHYDRLMATRCGLVKPDQYREAFISGIWCTAAVIIGTTSGSARVVVAMHKKSSEYNCAFGQKPLAVHRSPG